MPEVKRKPERTGKIERFSEERVDEFSMQKLRSGVKRVEHQMFKELNESLNGKVTECTSSVERESYLNANFWAKMNLRMTLSYVFVVCEMIGAMRELDPSWLLSWV